MASNSLIQLFSRCLPGNSTSVRDCRPAVRILITGAAGRIGYAIVPMIARGLMFGPQQPVILHLFDTLRSAETLRGLEMELEDAALPLLRGVIATTAVEEAFAGVNFTVMLAGAARKEGMSRSDLLSINAGIYKDHGLALQQHAAANCKVLVVANPANTNALILKEFAPSVSPKNITCLTRLDHNRALAQLARRLRVPVAAVKNVVVWGNHSSTQFPDAAHATVTMRGMVRPVTELIADDKWLRDELVSIVQQRGEAVITAHGGSSALSAASAACDHMRDWFIGTPKGRWTSMGVYSDGAYAIPRGIFYSFPVTCRNGEWSIVQGVGIDAYARSRMTESAEELLQEAAAAAEELT